MPESYLDIEHIAIAMFEAESDAYVRDWLAQSEEGKEAYRRMARTAVLAERRKDRDV